MVIANDPVRAQFVRLGSIKTLADCFKFRNKVGLDVALEALKTYRKRRRPRLQQVLEFARICRVEKIVRPYLEASVWLSS